MGWPDVWWVGWWLCGTRPARSWPAWGYLPSDRPLGGVGRPGSVSCGSASWWACLPGIGWAGLAHREWRSLGWPGRGRPAERRPASGPPALGLAAQGRPAGGPPRSQAAVGGAPVGRCGALTLQPCGSFNSTVPLVVAYLVFVSCSGVCAVGVSPFCVLLASRLYYVCILFIFCLFYVYFLFIFCLFSVFFLFFFCFFSVFFLLFFCLFSVYFLFFLRLSAFYTVFGFRAFWGVRRWLFIFCLCHCLFSVYFLFIICLLSVYYYLFIFCCLCVFSGVATVGRC